MTRLGEFHEAAYEAAWMCRLSESRLLTPAHPGAMNRYVPDLQPGMPWKYDYYSHVLASKRLWDAAKAINGILHDADLAAAIETFERHWTDHLHALRTILQHPINTSINWQRDVRVFRDRIEYRLPGCDPLWQLSIGELHTPVEALWSAIEVALMQDDE